MPSGTWDPSGSLAMALWISGGQWAGKSTVADLLARRHGLVAYHYDYHDARAHNDRRIARRAERGESLGGPDLEQAWVLTTPAEMARETLAGFPERFEWTLDDLRALYSSRPIVAEGWGLRPELVAPLVDFPRRMVVMVPTEEFRRHQLSMVTRAGSMTGRFSDPERAQRNRVGRDRLLAADAVRSALRLGMRVIEVDGAVGAEGVADQLSEHWAPYLALP